ncbi:unnamed protein product [Trichogramma brassicae]|uniref:Uncharacterized protein n=1 Tax=Trichogramma brassicae TaxID=86971 RepID=A0A6H5IBX4_9HYME|nr:unnamed protein product [Trichogramma brassicae]
MQFNLAQKAALAGIGMFVFSVLYTTAIFPTILKFQLKRKVALKKGWMMRDTWSKFPFVVNMNFYMFNVTNPEAIKEGEKPIVQEVGPFVYDKYHEKTNQEDRDEDDTISFTMRDTYFFNAEKSNGLTGDEEIIVPHYLILGIVNALLRTKPTAVPIVGKAVDIIFSKPNSIFIKAKVKDILFDGLFIDCTAKDFAGAAICSEVKAAHEEFGLKMVAEDQYLLSLWAARNGTDAQGPSARQARPQEHHGRGQGRRVRQQGQHLRVGRRLLRPVQRHRRHRLSSQVRSARRRRHRRLQHGPLPQRQLSLPGQEQVQGHQDAEVLGGSRHGRRAQRAAQVLLPGARQVPEEGRLRPDEVHQAAAGAHQSALLHGRSVVLGSHTRVYARYYSFIYLFLLKLFFFLGPPSPPPPAGKAPDADRSGAAVGCTGAGLHAGPIQHVHHARAQVQAHEEVPRRAAAALLVRRADRAAGLFAQGDTRRCGHVQDGKDVRQIHDVRRTADDHVGRWPVRQAELRGQGQLEDDGAEQQRRQRPRQRRRERREEDKHQYGTGADTAQHQLKTKNNTSYFPCKRERISYFVCLKEGNMFRSIWSKLPFAIEFHVYMFNVTNHEDVETTGAKPIVREIGPYVYESVLACI